MLLTFDFVLYWAELEAPHYGALSSKPVSKLTIEVSLILIVDSGFEPK